MRVPLTLIDFLDRAELFGDRTLLVDEPGGPASLGRVSGADLVRRARGMALELDAWAWATASGWPSSPRTPRASWWPSSASAASAASWCR